MRHATWTKSTLLAGLLLILGGSAPVQAQSAVTLGHIGYTAIGMTAGGGLGALAGTECDGFICIPPGVVVGAMLGAGGGLLASGAVSESVRAARDAGQPLGSGQMFALTLGSAVGGATLGALISSILISPDGAGTFMGSDEQTFWILAAAGTGLGIYRAIQFQRSIVPDGVTIQPDVMLDGRAGVTVSMTF